MSGANVAGAEAMNSVTLPFAYCPNLAPDELLFSLFARTHALNSRQNPRETLRVLSGCSNAIPSVDLPTRLGHFVSHAIGSRMFASIEDVLSRATLFPYYELFMSPERRARAVDAMTGNGGPGLKIAMGLVANGFGASTTWKSCAACDRKSLATNGFLIWSRCLHLPGVEVCPLHGKPLQSLSVQSLQSNRHELPMPLVMSSPAGVTSSPATSPLLRLAGLSLEALNHVGPVPEPRLRREAYMAGLRHVGLASGKRIHWQALVGRIHDQYAGFADMSYRTRLLSSAADPMRWVRDLLERPQRSLHPICHLLFIGAVFGSVASLLETVDRLRHSASTPAPGPHFGASAAENVDAALELLYDIRLSCRKVAATCGVSVTTIVVRRRALGLPIAERRKSLSPKARRDAERLLARGADIADVAKRTAISLSQAYRLLAAAGEVGSLRAALIAERRQTEKRKAWLALQRRFPTLPVTELRAKAPAIYTWLYRNDKAWLASTQHAVRRELPTRRQIRVDWTARDRALAEMVRCTASRERDDLSDQRRTVTSLMRALGAEASIRRNLYRLPELHGQLVMQSETREQFRTRRIAAAVKKLAQQGIDNPADWQIIRTAGLRTQPPRRCGGLADSRSCSGPSDAMGD